MRAYEQPDGSWLSEETGYGGPVCRNGCTFDHHTNKHPIPEAYGEKKAKSPQVLMGVFFQEKEICGACGSFRWRFTKE